MSRNVHRALAGAILSATLLNAIMASAAVTVDFEVQPRALRVGEAAICAFTVRGADNPPTPVLPSIPGFQVTMAGTERSMSFGTGGSDSTTTFRYRLIPLQTGKFAIGPFAYTAQNETVNLPAIAIEVVAPDAQPSEQGGQQQISELLFATLSAPRTNVFHQETFDVILALYSRGLNLAGDIAPLNMPEAGLTVQPFQELQGAREVVNNQVYDVRRFRAKAQALTAGTFRFEPTIRVGIRVPRERRQSRDPFGGFPESMDEFFGFVRVQPVDIAPKPIEIVVAPLPPRDTEDGFSGAVGRFAFDAQIKPSEVGVGDPVTLTMQITGEGNLDNVAAPTIKHGEQFKTYEAKMVSKDWNANQTVGRKIFEQVFIPRSTNLTEFPAVPFAYFDAEKGAYETIKRGPFPLTVRPSSNGASRMVQASHVAADTPPLLLGSDIVYLKSAPARWTRSTDTPGYRTRGFLAVQIVPALALLATAFVTRRRRVLETNVALARRYRAPKSARAGIRKAEEALRTGSRAEFFEAVAETLASYFGHRLNLTPGAVTAEAVSDALDRAGMGKEDRSGLAAIFERCEQERFGRGRESAAARDDASLSEAIQALQALLRKCEKAAL